MIEGLKPYPEYRDSGLPWLGEIPSHWGTRRLDRLFNLRNERPRDGDQRVTGYLSGRVTLRSNVAGQKIKGVIKEAGWQRIYPGDFAVSGMNAHLGGLGVSDSLGKCSPIYLVLKPHPTTNAHFVAHAVRHMAQIGLLKTMVNTIRFNSADFKREDLKSFQVWLPAGDERNAIVRFLDYANRRIERYIRAKEKLIALLNEQKQVIIHRAVIRGLDPNVSLKPSGIPWLGEIPEHWEVVPLKSVCFIQSGVTLGKNYFGANLVEYPYLRVANVQAGHLDLNRVKTLRLPDNEARRSLLLQGDVLMTEGGDPDKLGRGCVWEGKISPCLHQNHIFAVRPTLQRLLPQFLEALLISSYAKDYFLRTAKQTTNLASTNKTTIGNLRVVLPSISEQTRILEGLELEGEPVNEAISRSEHEIALMREYRTRLVADVVTGQLDVREAAAKLPEKSEELEVEPIEESTEDEGETSEFEDMVDSGTIRQE